jgi:hypothetical protein
MSTSKNISKYFSRHSLKAVACVIAAFDLIRTNKRICEGGEKFLREWVRIILIHFR